MDFSLYDELPLFSGDLLVGWSPLADELPALVQDELQPQEDVHMYPTSAPGVQLVKGHLIEEPKQVEEPNMQSVLLDTSVNLLDLLQPEGSSQPPVSPEVMSVDIPKELEKQSSVEDMLQNVSDMLMANLTPVHFVGENDTTNQNIIDLSSLHDLSGETGMLNVEEVDCILNGREDPVDTLLNNSSTGLAADILSPVSPEDVDYILSSSPNSPLSINASSPCSSNSIYSSYPTSPFSLDTSLETEPSVVETSDAPVTISMKYLREELLRPSPCSIEENKKETQKRVSGRQRSQRQRVKYEPYSPSPIDSMDSSYSKTNSKSNDHRSERKKQQNKDAALRYRQKKREEKGTVKEECDKLEKKNTELKDKVDSMTREIQYLKDLLAEVYKAKATTDKKKSK